MTHVVVCGSRDWIDGDAIRTALIWIMAPGRPLYVRHGAARGADRLAGESARAMGIPVTEYPADWNGLGKGAGHARNRMMLRTYPKPDLVLAFKDGLDWTLTRGGTESMVRIASEAKVPVHVFSHDETGNVRNSCLTGECWECR